MPPDPSNLPRTIATVGTALPDHPDVLLQRKASVAALHAAGFPIAESTLATLATRGGGPVYRSFGRTPLYRWGDLLDWAESRLTSPRRSTAEADVQRNVAGTSPHKRNRPDAGRRGGGNLVADTAKIEIPPDRGKS